MKSTPSRISPPRSWCPNRSPTRLLYYLNNTAKARNLLECAARHKIKHFIFSSTAAVYGEPEQPDPRNRSAGPINPYGRSKLMTEWMLQDAGKAHGLNYVILRYFNVAGADPKGRLGQSTPQATHLIKVAVQAALGFRPGLEVFGTDYPTRDGTCIRDYIQVTDLVAAHLMALELLAQGRRKSHLQLRLRQGLLGVRSRRCRQSSVRASISRCRFRRAVRGIRPRSSPGAEPHQIDA